MQIPAPPKNGLVIIQNLYDERYMMGQALEMNYIVRSMITQLEYGDVNV